MRQTDVKIFWLLNNKMWTFIQENKKSIIQSLGVGFNFAILSLVIYKGYQWSIDQPKISSTSSTKTINNAPIDYYETYK